MARRGGHALVAGFDEGRRGVGLAQGHRDGGRGGAGDGLVVGLLDGLWKWVGSGRGRRGGAVGGVAHGIAGRILEKKNCSSTELLAIHTSLALPNASIHPYPPSHTHLVPPHHIPEKVTRPQQPPQPEGPPQ